MDLFDEYCISNWYVVDGCVKKIMSKLNMKEVNSMLDPEDTLNEWNSKETELGFDSFPVHLASYYQKKIVAIFAHYANNTKPYFSHNSDCILLEPDHSRIKPVFADTDTFNQINTIDPDKIYILLIKLLNL